MASPTLAILRNREVSLFVASRFFGAASMTFLRAAVAWQVFELTGSAFALGALGLVQFIPVVPLGLMGGAVADRHERRSILLTTHAVTLGCLALLGWASAAGFASSGLVYGVALAVAASTSIQNPASAALLPSLVAREDFPAATTVSAAARNVARGLGPLLMGAALAATDMGSVYALNMGLELAAILLLSGLRRRPVPVERRGVVSLAAVREGLAYVWSRQPVLGAMTLDMVAVFFASVVGLMPIFATEILQVGPRGYGLLNAGLEIGMTLMSLVLVALPPVRRAGPALLWAVGIFGLATLVFALSRSFALSVAAMVVAGMADQVSVVSRQMIVQLSTPDELRGRVSSVNLMFIGASNQLGAAESGFLAALTTATFSALFGSLACLAALGVVAARMPELRRYRTTAH